MTEEKKRARKSYENQNWNRWGTPRGRSTDPVQGTDGTDCGCAEGGERSDQYLAEIRLLQRKYRVLPDLGWNPVLWDRQWWNQCTYERQYLPDKIQLYELEELLPGSFMRISKSAIVNTSHIYSISRNLTASSVVAFADTHKQVYVSRYYYKPLINKLEEKRLHQWN